MARKKASSKSRSGVSTTVLFWTAFFVVITLLFIINIPKITQTWNAVFTKKSDAQNQSVIQETQTERPAVSESQGSSGIGIASVQSSDDITAGILLPEENILQNGNNAIAEEPDDNSENNVTQTRERTVYLVKVDGTGMVFLQAAKRNVPVNESPLVSTLNLLLSGPTEDEKKRGIVSLLPSGTRILGASVKGSVATINFNENFIFNSFGAEGYIAQLKQIVWTATEFPNISEVQVVIEGKRVEFLGETVRIDRPWSRDTI